MSARYKGLPIAVRVVDLSDPRPAALRTEGERDRATAVIALWLLVCGAVFVAAFWWWGGAL